MDHTTVGEYTYLDSFKDSRALSAGVHPDAFENAVSKWPEVQRMSSLPFLEELLLQVPVHVTKNMHIAQHTCTATQQMSKTIALPHAEPEA